MSERGGSNVLTREDYMASVKRIQRYYYHTSEPDPEHDVPTPGDLAQLLDLRIHACLLANYLEPILSREMSGAVDQLTDKQLDEMLVVADAANRAEESNTQVWIDYWNTFHPRAIGALITAIRDERADHQQTNRIVTNGLNELEDAINVKREEITRLRKGIKAADRLSKAARVPAVQHYPDGELMDEESPGWWSELHAARDAYDEIRSWE